MSSHATFPLSPQTIGSEENQGFADFGVIKYYGWKRVTIFQLDVDSFENVRLPCVGVYRVKLSPPRQGRATPTKCCTHGCNLAVIVPWHWPTFSRLFDNWALLGEPECAACKPASYWWTLTGPCNASAADTTDHVSSFLCLCLSYPRPLGDSFLSVTVATNVHKCVQLPPPVSGPSDVLRFNLKLLLSALPLPIPAVTWPGQWKWKQLSIVMCFFVMHMHTLST